MALLRQRWFGEPWPSEEERAPICDEDVYRIETPVGRPCLYCPDPITDGDRGVVMASEPAEDTFPLQIGEGVFVPAVAVHIDCLVRASLGPELEAMVSHAAGVTRRPHLALVEDARPSYEEQLRALDGPVLGRCPHGVDLDRDFCPHGCRV